MTAIHGRVLIIAGSDSGGGAGIQGDIKTVSALGGYAATAITALTVQNTLGVTDIHPVPPAFVAGQIHAVLSDIGADAIKTGMLYSADIIEAIADALEAYPGIPLIVDPVMVAKGGAPLLKPDAVAALTSRLFPKAALLTPNIPEAELLAGSPIRDVEDMRCAAQAIRARGARAVLMKGGHLEERGETITNLLLDADKEQRFTTPRLSSRHTHGTGCALASAIATGLAQGMGLVETIERAQSFVHQAILNASGLGSGHGPLGHSPLTVYAQSSPLAV